MALLSRLSLLLMSLLVGLSGAAPIGVKGFSFTGVRGRLITANSVALFSFTNTRDSAGSLKIYDTRGHQVAVVDIPSGATSVSWDGRAGGQLVAAGIYVYAITVEDTTASGAVAVVR